MGDLEILIFGSIFIVAVLATFISIFVISVRGGRHKTGGEELEISIEDYPDKDEISVEEEEPTAYEAELVAYEATLTDKRIVTLRAGTHLPTHSVEFRIVFETSEGEKKFKVEQDFFDRFNEGDKGTLVIAGDRVFDFGKGEDVE